ncbi:hypothetical protein Y1Q_0022953 [Alligator mississippiensis]|uniref:Uncharacterized protein n=1 Tax=Alligator mississippiensis TaxID=8496 RepID=A0A151P7B5_ALLMI|nr:hypothetical protein Y1Q_0022953 [Alligator mississippiensis]
MKLLESKAENAQLKEKIKTMGPLLEADQVRETEKDKDLHLSSKAKVNQRITVSSQLSYNDWLREFKEKILEMTE